MLSMNSMYTLTTGSLLVALVSFVYQTFVSLQRLSTITKILTGLLAIESASRQATIGQERPRVAVGYGACTDLLLSATEFLEFTPAAVEIGPDFVVDEVNDEKELLQSFGYYFKNGAAAERFMPDARVFQKLLTSATTQPNNTKQWATGGNAPMMSIRFHQEGADVLLGARMSQKLRKHIPSAIQLAGDLIPEDDVHLILEYKSGEKWGPYTAPRANRYILHNDQNNPHISSLEAFDKEVQMFKPRLLVVSGLQMMDSYKFENGIRESRLKKIAQHLSSQPASTLIHFEMASYVELELLNNLVDTILPFSESLGMNEQELDNLRQVLEFGKLAFASDSNPRVASTLDSMRTVFKMLNERYFKGQNESSKARMLTRIHVHTLAYQALLIVKDSQWKNSKNSAAKAALTANRYVCGEDNIDPKSAVLILDESFATSANGWHSDQTAPTRVKLDPSNPVSCWDETIKVSNENIEYEICVAPVLVCRVAKKTAGAGDNISAAGLSQQI